MGKGSYGGRRWDQHARGQHQGQGRWRLPRPEAVDRPRPGQGAQGPGDGRDRNREGDGDRVVKRLSAAGRIAELRPLGGQVNTDCPPPAPRVTERCSPSRGVIIAEIDEATVTLAVS